MKQLKLKLSILKKLITEEVQAAMTHIDMNHQQLNSYVNDVDNLSDSLSRMLDMYETGNASYQEVSDIIADLYEVGLTYEDIIELDPRVSSLSGNIRVFEQRKRLYEGPNRKYTQSDKRVDRIYPTANRRGEFHQFQRVSKIPQLKRQLINLLDERDELKLTYNSRSNNSSVLSILENQLENIANQLDKVAWQLADAGLTNEEIDEIDPRFRW